MNGLIIKTHNRFYRVRVEDGELLCSLKGTRKRAEPEYRLPVIGDQVVVQRTESSDGVDGYIIDIQSRRNRLVRNLGDPRQNRVMAANLDLLLIIMAATRPALSLGLIDRYILACEIAEIPFAIVINKVDLNTEIESDHELMVYRRLGIPIHFCSAKSGHGLDALKASLSQGISLFTGPSGAGKSTLINHFAPSAALTTGEVGAKRGLGKHTTTNSSLINIGGSGYLADSPGLRDFNPPPVEPEQVRFGFREMVAAQVDCRFSTCMHRNEPGCAVRRAVDGKGIEPFRYHNYLSILEEMRDFFQNRYM